MLVCIIQLFAYSFITELLQPKKVVNVYYGIYFGMYLHNSLVYYILDILGDWTF